MRCQIPFYSLYCELQLILIPKIQKFWSATSDQPSHIIKIFCIRFFCCNWLKGTFSWNLHSLFVAYLITMQRRACAAKGSSDCSWTGLRSIYSVCNFFFETLTFRSPFQPKKASLRIFNGLQYCLAAGQVFVAFTDPVSVSFG